MAISDIDLNNLDEKEFKIISRVLHRDRTLRIIEENRLLPLKMELQSLRRRGALRQGLDTTRCCARCTSELGRLINRGALCAVCRKKVCKACRQYGDVDKQWVCVVCRKQMEFKATSGEWMQEFSRRSSKRRVRRIPAGDVLLRAILETRRKGSINRERHQIRKTSDSKSVNAERLEHQNFVPDQVERHGKHSESPFILEIRKQFKKLELSPLENKLFNNLKRSESQPALDEKNRFQPISPVINEITRHLKGADNNLVQEIKRRFRHSEPESESVDLSPEPIRLKKISKSAETLAEISRNYQIEEMEKMNLIRKLSKPDNSSSSSSASPDYTRKSLHHQDSSNARSRSTSSDMEDRWIRGSITKRSPTRKERPGGDTDSAYSTSPRATHLKPTDTRPTSGSASSISESEVEKSTGVIFRKVTLKKRKSNEEREKANSDESNLSHRPSPHGRLRVRGRSLSGGSDDCKQENASVPQISVCDYTENASRQNSTASSDKVSASIQDDDVDQVFSYSRSQLSLSSFAGISESMTSVYSAAGGGRYGTVVVSGEVLFGLSYNYKASCMEVHIKECRNLAAVDTRKNRSDPYTKVYLLPDRTKSGKRKTKVKKHTLNPNFDEILKFPMTISELETRTLWLSIWHSDMFGRNDFLGEVMLPLGYEVFENPGLRWYPLQERLESLDSPISYKGDLNLALKYVPPDVTMQKPSKRSGRPAKGSLHVLVKEARNLMAVRSNGTSDPFCKSYLLPDKSKSGKQKTHVIKKTCNPKWNHTFVYDDVSIEDLHDRCLELTIWDYDKITSNDFLGGVRLNLGTGKYEGRDVEWMDSQGEEMIVWRSVLDKPNMWIDCSLLLRSSMQSRRTL